MAEEGLRLPATPESRKLVVAYLRRNSTGSYVPPSGDENILPHYMRASIGSCHDFCKYGKKNAIEDKVRWTFSKRTSTKPSNEQNSSESLDVPLRKVTSAVKSEKPSASRIHAHGASDIIKPEMTIKSHQIKNTRKDEAMKEKAVSLLGPRSLLSSKSYPSHTSRPLKQVQTSFEKVRVSSSNASTKAKEVILSGEHTALSKLKSVTEKKCSSTAPSEALRAKKTVRAGETSLYKRVVNSKISLRKTTSSPRATLALRQSLSRAASLTARKLKSLKVVSTLKNQNKTSMDKEQPDIKETNKDEPEEKTLYAIKVEAEDQPFESDKNEGRALECSPSLESTAKLCAIKMEDKVLESDRRETCTGELLKHPSVSPESPSIQTCERFSGVDEEEYEITESGAEDGSVSEDDEAVNVQERCPLKAEKHASEKKSQTVALRFKRGKVVCIQSENNGVRRLNFRRARMLEHKLNDKAEVCTSLRKREVCADMNDETSGGEKVVLRHQDVEGKKDSQGLFNNVIEQTASKLVESRKSKVKALVGAFETVISLQDRKPSETVLS